MIHTRRIKSALAATLALSAIAASPAAARPAVYSPPSGDSGAAITCAKGCSDAGHSTSTVAESGGSFDWGDAAIGAGGAVVILLVGAGGVHAVGSRRTRDAGSVNVTAAS
jgi:hypothetical protein